jgi:hypothetical protein
MGEENETKDGVNSTFHGRKVRRPTIVRMNAIHIRKLNPPNT